MTDLTNEEALRSLAIHYQRRAAELEEGLVVANAKIERLQARIAAFEASATDTDLDTVSND